MTAKVGDHVRHGSGVGCGILVTHHGGVFVGNRTWYTVVSWTGAIKPTDMPPSEELWAAYVQYCLIEGEPK